jgi:type I restriction enzyme, S subunit
VENRLKPEIRFPEFSEDWKLRDLGDLLSNLKSGLSRMLSNQDIGLPVIRANNINNGILDLDNDIKYWYVDDPQGANTKNYLIQKHDILVNFINSEAKMGTAAIVESEPKRPTIYTTNILNLRTNQDANPYFINSLTMTKKYKNYIKLITKPAVNQASFTTVDFKKYSFLAPLIEEQTKIGHFFKHLEDIIALHQQELTILKQTKQGFLQKMFPKEGESVPEVRFPGFTGDWKQRKIREIGNLSAGGDIDKSKLVDNGKYPVLANALTNNGLVGYYNEYKIEAPAVTITGRGDVGHAKARHISFTPVVRLLVLKVNDFDVDFLENCINTRNIFVESTGVPQLTAPQLGAYEIKFPSFREQTSIGSFFKQIDETIALHQLELDALKETKKAFLQKMFV